MATVIDALVMTLGLDDREYVKGQKRADESLTKFKQKADAVGKDVALGGKKMAEGFSLVKNELLGLLALFGASMGIKSFIADSVKGQAELGRLAKNLDMSGVRLRAWGVIAKGVGGDAKDAFSALQSVAGGLAEASIRGHSAFTDMARANGVALTDAKGNVLSYEDALLSISKRMRELPRQQAMYLANQMGVGSMFNELMLGPEELKRRREEAEKLSGVTQQSIERAQELQHRWSLIQERFSVFGKTGGKIFAKLEPVLERLATRFANWLDSIDWDKIIDGIAALAGKVNEIVKAFGGWKTVALLLGGVLALKVLTPVTSLIIGLGRLIPLLATTTSGLWALAAAGAAVAGAKIGSSIYHNTMEGNASGRGAGSLVANVLAAFGNKNAMHATANAYWDGLSDAEKKRAADAYRQYSPGEKAKFDAENPFAASIHAYLTGQPRAAAAVNSQHSQAYATNAELFSHLETMGGLPKGLLQRMFMQESGGGKNLLSSAGAKGPFQFMDATAAEAGLKGDDVYDLDKSAAAAAGYLVRLHNQFGSWEKAVAAYNAGPGNVRKYGGTPPFAETQNYVKQVLGGSGPAQRLGGNMVAGTTSTSTAETHIGKIEVHTAATDANGIVRDMRRAIADNALIASADTGLN